MTDMVLDEKSAMKEMVLDYGQEHSLPFSERSAMFKSISLSIDGLFARLEAAEAELRAARAACTPHPTADVDKPIAAIVEQRLRTARAKIQEAEDLAEDRFAAWGRAATMGELAGKMRPLLGVIKDGGAFSLDLLEECDAVCKEYDAVYNLNDRDTCTRVGIDVAAAFALATLRAKVIETLDAVDTWYCECCQEAPSDALDKGEHKHSECPLRELRAAVARPVSAGTFTLTWGPPMPRAESSKIPGGVTFSTLVNEQPADLFETIFALKEQRAALLRELAAANHALDMADGLASNVRVHGERQSTVTNNARRAYSAARAMQLAKTLEGANTK